MVTKPEHIQNQIPEKINHSQGSQPPAGTDQNPSEVNSMEVTVYSLPAAAASGYNPAVVPSAPPMTDSVYGSGVQPSAPPFEEEDQLEDPMRKTVFGADFDPENLTSEQRLEALLRECQAGIISQEEFNQRSAELIQ